LIRTFLRISTHEVITLMKTTNLKKLRQMLFATISVIGFAMMTSAQTESARIQGTVTDTAGAVVAGATIKVTDSDTARAVTTVSGDDGSYSFLSLQPGRYQIEVTGANFKTTKQEITLEVAQNASLDFALEAGAVTETVTVTADVPQIETSTSAIGNS